MFAGFFDRPSRFQSAHHHQPPLGAGVRTVVFRATQAFGAERNGHVKFLADSRQISGVLALPERVTKHHARSAATGLIVRIDEDPTQRRLNPQRTEETAADLQPRRPARFSARAQVVLAGTPRKNAGKGLLTSTDLIP